MTKNITFKRILAGLLALVLVGGAVPANTRAFDLFTVTPVVASAENTIADTLTADKINDTSSYSSWTYTSTDTGVTYAGNTMKGSSATIQMRSTNNSGIVIKSSNKNVTGITVAWNDSTIKSRTLYVYGSDTAYSAASDLYNSSKQGSQLGTISKGTSTFTIDGEYKYKYIGIRSSNGALYLDSVGFQFGSSDVAVTDVTLDKTKTQTINVGGKVAFTATVAPNNATDKKVKWSVGGTNADAVTLYTDEACTAGNEVGTDATDVLTVYAKGVSAGNATVTVTSNADSTKYADCSVTVTAPDPAFGNVSLTLKDDLGLNFIVDNVTADNAEDYKVVLSGECAENEQKQSIRIKTIEGQDYYCVTANVPAKNMTDKITAKLFKGDSTDPISTLEYSVEDYLRAARKLALENSDQKLGELIKKTAQYGASAYYYFFGGTKPNVTDHKNDILAAGFDYSINDATMSLVLKSKLAVRLYIPGLEKGAKAGSYEAVEGTGNRYCFEITGLTPTDLAKEITLEYGGKTYRFSAMSWCARVMSRDDLDPENYVVANALYEYYLAAMAYVTPPAPTTN